MNITSLKLDLIEAGKDRLRTVNEGYAQELAESFKALGQIVPIEVVETRKGSGKYRIIHGAHRVRAAEISEIGEVLAVIWEGDKRHEKGRQIAENLIRAPLTVMAKAISIAEWQKLYPKAQLGGDRRSDQFAKIANYSDRFTVHAAEKLGVSERSVYLLLNIHAGITTPVRNLIEGTALEDHQESLIALAGVEEGDAQLKIATAMLETGKTFKELMSNAPAPTAPADQKAFDGFVKRFQKADDKGRRRIIQWLVDHGHIQAEQVAFS